MANGRELEKKAAQRRDLAQETKLQGKPLRMILTRPAGAGKSNI